MQHEEMGEGWRKKSLNDICFAVKNRFSFGFWTICSFIRSRVRNIKIDSCRLRIHQLSYFMHALQCRNNNGNNFL